MKIAKKEMLKLIGTWVARSNDPMTVIQNFIPPLLEAVLFDYQTSPADARDAEVLATMATIVNTLQQYITPDIVLNIFSAVFESTIQMISQVCGCCPFGLFCFPVPSSDVLFLLIIIVLTLYLQTSLVW